MTFVHRSCPHCHAPYPALLPAMRRPLPTAPVLTVPSFTNYSCFHRPVLYPALLSALCRPFPTAPARAAPSFTQSPAHSPWPPGKHSRIVNRFVNVLTFTELREQNPQREYGYRFRIGRQHPDSWRRTAAGRWWRCWRRCGGGSGDVGGGGARSPCAN